MVALKIFGSVMCVLWLSSSAWAACGETVDSGAVDNLPSLDQQHSGMLSKDTLTLVFTAPQLVGRNLSSIELQPGQAACNYEDGVASSTWVRTLGDEGNGCVDTYTLTIDFSTAASDCGLVRADSLSDAHIVFTGNVTVSQKDWLPDIRGQAVTRQVETYVEFQLLFPKTIDVHTDSLTVYAPASLHAAVIASDFVKPSSVAQLSVYTSLQWPFVLRYPNISVDDNANVHAEIAESASACPEGGPCTATFIVTATLNSGCVFDGTYHARFLLGCDPSFAGDCPLQGELAELVVSVTSGSMCGTFQDTVDLSGSLTSYLPDYTTKRTGFVQNQVAYFEVAVNSSKATIVGTTLRKASSQFGAAASVELYNALTVGVTDDGAGVHFATDTPADPLPMAARFHYTFSDEFYALDEDETSTAVVSATVSVEFAGAGAPLAKRTLRFGGSRARQSGSTRQQQSVQASAVVGVSRAVSGGGGGQATTSQSSGGGGLSGAAMFGIGAACVVGLAGLVAGTVLLVKHMRAAAAPVVSV